MTYRCTIDGVAYQTPVPWDELDEEWRTEFVRFAKAAVPMEDHVTLNAVLINMNDDGTYDARLMWLADHFPGAWVE
jgi:hypothetical protein